MERGGELLRKETELQRGFVPSATSMIQKPYALHRTVLDHRLYDEGEVVDSL
jgi:hypothetical protein